MKSGKYAILSASLALSLMLAGCSNNQTTAEEGTVSSVTGSQYQSETIVGEVSELSGSEVTVTLGNLSSFEDIMGGEGAPSEDTPSGEVADGEAPSGEETYTFMITDESVIYLEEDGSEESEEQGTLDDIQEGSILSMDFASKLICCSCLSL